MLTVSHAPDVGVAFGFHHWSEVPPFRLQSVTDIEVNVLEGETSISKYTGDGEAGGTGTGSEPYSEITTAPSPIALTVVESLTAVAVPVLLVEVPLLELVVPDGGGGGGGVGEVIVPPLLPLPTVSGVVPYEPAKVESPE